MPSLGVEGFLGTDSDRLIPRLVGDLDFLGALVNDLVFTSLMNPLRFGWAVALVSPSASMSAIGKDGPGAGRVSWRSMASGDARRSFDSLRESTLARGACLSSTLFLVEF